MLSLHGLTKDSKSGSVEEIVRYAEDVEEAASYYGEGNRAPAAWAGVGAAALGLADTEYGRAQMINLLQGLGPRGENLSRISERHRPGWDLTFSAPKSVSAAWAVADEAHQEEIEAAHDAAIRAAIAHIEAQGIVLVRSGQGGVEKEEAAGLTFATFRHGTSRVLEPDIHTHCLLINLSTTAEGEWRRLDPAAIYRRKIEIGAVYRAELSAQMEALGYATDRDETSFRLKRFSQSLCDKWSTRRDEIKATLGDIDAGGKAKATAALASRSKKRRADRDELHSRWRAEAAGMGVTAKRINKTRGRPEWRDAETMRKEIIAEVVSTLTERKSVFTENEIRREIAIAAQCRVSASAIPGVVNSAILSQQLVALPEARDGEGKRLPMRWTTREMLDLETKLAEGAVVRKGEGRHQVSAVTIETAIREAEEASGFSLKAEQRAAVMHVCSGADGVSCVNGIAGAGKSTGLDAARRAWEAEGYRVRGTALQARAAAQLQQSAAIKSDTLSMLLAQVTPDARFGEIADPLSKRDIIVLDEAGMVGSRQMAGIAAAANREGAKIVLVGDHRQYQTISAGGAFGALCKRLGIAKLSENIRQYDKNHRKAVDQIRRGEIAEALDYYRSQGALIIAQGRGIEEATIQWQMDREKVGEDHVLMISARHDAARALNSEARYRIGQTGRGVEIAVQNREKQPAGLRDFAVGDKIVFRRNNRKLGVWNGDKGIIEAIEAHTGERSATLTIRHGEREIPIDTRKYSAIDHGLAITGHSSQGLTDERVVFHIEDSQFLDLHALYVGASRARDRTTIVISRHALDDAAAAEGIEEADSKAQLTNLIKALGRVRYKEFAADYFEDQNKFIDLDEKEISRAETSDQEAAVAEQ